MVGNIDNVRIGDVDMSDYPDFTDAFIDSADLNGVPMTEEQLDELNEDRDFVFDCIMSYLY